MLSSYIAGHEIAEPDHCEPHEATVEVRVDNLSPTSRLFPKCVVAKRCGGCCAVNNVICKPTHIEYSIYHLLEIGMIMPELQIGLVGTYTVEVEQHLSCRCECTLSEEKCGPLKTFDSFACDCRCTDMTNRCHPPKVLSLETCGCVCARKRECCPGGNYCGRYFNTDTYVISVADITSQCIPRGIRVNNSRSSHTRSPIQGQRQYQPDQSTLRKLISWKFQSGF
ncbi:platelet-derived growth factor subunit b [Plakobranchus ocellatus]|uniref:Platelet-derived growth factor subunit b n=1 Tax=Plakobranchus ocellatus TaxID=259542 RepID=A0AAV3Y7J5_9GAST|nr:platelet-derived growth factor subunit b [Plakobranchus ocellatus]